MYRLFFPLIALFTFNNLYAQMAESGFRGPSRDGIYPAKGLLKSWPADGLPLVWSSTQVGKGYSSPVVTNGKVYVGGLSEDGNQEILTALSSDGKLLWQVPYGTAWGNTYPDSRSTPTIVGNDLYIESGKPEMVCVDATTGAIKWKIDAVERYNRKPTEYGPAESPLVVGDVLYFTTMSDKASLIAVSRKNGEVIWETPPFKGDLMYASPIFIEHRGKKQIIILNEFYATGIDQLTGAIAWQANIFDLVKEGVPDNKWRPQFTNTPVFKDGKFCISSGYDYGTLMLQLNEDATSVSQLWLNRDLDPHHGGVVLIDGKLYGSNWTDNNRGNWCCVDWNTGKTLYENPWTGGNKGSIISAENLLYCIDDKRGNIALAKPTPEKFDIINSFRITQGSGPYWAHPCISNGNLYIRHGEVLLVYSLM